jgi:hypothetical protein
MNTRLINIIRSLLPSAASSVFLVLGAAFAASALVAQDEPKTAPTTKAKPTIPNCLASDWPPQDPKKQWLITAFETALHDSAMANPNSSPWPTGPALRTKLLDTKNNFQSPKNAIGDILRGQGHNMQLPPDLVIVFYEPEPKATATPTAAPVIREKKDEKATYLHPNHCYLILYLEPADSLTLKDPNPNFQAHVMCCYDPY